MKRTAVTLAALLATMTVAGQTAYAQQDKALPPITLDLRDAPIRQALEQLFASAKVDFQIDNNVAGFVTLKITDQPFENALKLILRSSPVPLTYAKESNVYIVKIRPVIATDPSLAAAPPPPLEGTQKPNYQPLEQIQLTFVDPMDLAGILGIQLIMTTQRQMMMGGMGGMMGGMGGGMMGGMGGGMMGGMGGMGMGGMGMGGMGGGMMGGMGGMGMGGMGMGGMGGGMMGGGMMGGGMMGGGMMGGGMMGGGRGF